MLPTQVTNSSYPRLVSMDNQEQEEGQLDGKKVSQSSLPPFRSGGECSKDSSVNTSSHSLSAEAEATLLSSRTVNEQPVQRPEVTPHDRAPDLFKYQPKNREYVTAQLAQLTGESLAGTDHCGLTYKCQSHSWGDYKLTFSFTSCDPDGSPTTINDIGIQNSGLVNKDPKDLPPFMTDFDSIHHGQIIKYARTNGCSVQYDPSEVNQHKLAIGVLQESTAFSIKLKTEMVFKDSLPTPAWHFPDQILLFVTSNDLVEYGENTNHESKPITHAIALEADDQEVAIYGTDGNGKEKSHFPGIARYFVHGTFSNASQQGVPSILSRPFPNALRMIVTPAITYSESYIDESTNSPEVKHKDQPEQQTILSSSGLGSARLKTIPPSKVIRLLPSSMIDASIKLLN